MNPKFYTKKEAAELLKVSARTIDNYVERGLLTPYKTDDSDKSPVRFLIKEVEKIFCPKGQDFPNSKETPRKPEAKP